MNASTIMKKNNTAFRIKMFAWVAIGVQRQRSVGRLVIVWFLLDETSMPDKPYQIVTICN